AARRDAMRGQLTSYGARPVPELLIAELDSGEGLTDRDGVGVVVQPRLDDAVNSPRTWLR
ncbi:hypothetical protein, partial [Streptomyces rectiviolaceus]|uniref:hypothetical protein n=1 Tax=Streptomyces rectiviolaceus TaxID=332591 RepID=UPI0031CDAFAA